MSSPRTETRAVHALIKYFYGKNMREKTTRSYRINSFRALLSYV